jgi:hypothetical protein
MAQTTGKTPKEVTLSKPWKNHKAGETIKVTPRIYRDLLVLGVTPKGGKTKAPAKKTEPKAKAATKPPADKMIADDKKTK